MRWDEIDVNKRVIHLTQSKTGKKFGKSEKGAVWLSADRTSAYAFYQFWVNTEDADVGRYLRYFSFRSRPEIEELEKATAERPAAPRRCRSRRCPTAPTWSAVATCWSRS